MRTEQVSAWKIERIVHGTCRMVIRNIQGGKVVKVVLDFGPGTNTKPGIPEDSFDARHGLAYGMTRSDGIPTPGKRDIDSVRSQLVLKILLLEPQATLLEQGLDVGLDLIDFLAGCRPLIGRQSAKIFQASRQFAFPSKKRNPYRIKCSKVSSFGNL
jgi:hypothetical protein